MIFEEGKGYIIYQFLRKLMDDAEPQVKDMIHSVYELYQDEGLFGFGFTDIEINYNKCDNYNDLYDINTMVEVCCQIKGMCANIIDNICADDDYDIEELLTAAENTYSYIDIVMKQLLFTEWIFLNLD